MSALGGMESVAVPAAAGPAARLPRAHEENESSHAHDPRSKAHAWRAKSAEIRAKPCREQPA